MHVALLLTFATWYGIASCRPYAGESAAVSNTITTYDAPDSCTWTVWYLAPPGSPIPPPEGPDPNQRVGTPYNISQPIVGPFAQNLPVNTSCECRRAFSAFSLQNPIGDVIPGSFLVRLKVTMDDAARDRLLEEPEWAKGVQVIGRYPAFSTTGSSFSAYLKPEDLCRLWNQPQVMAIEPNSKDENGMTWIQAWGDHAQNQSHAAIVSDWSAFEAKGLSSWVPDFNGLKPGCVRGLQAKLVPVTDYWLHQLADLPKGAWRETPFFTYTYPLGNPWSRNGSEWIVSLKESVTRDAVTKILQAPEMRDARVWQDEQQDSANRTASTRFDEAPRTPRDFLDYGNSKLMFLTASYDAYCYMMNQAVVADLTFSTLFHEHPSP